MGPAREGAPVLMRISRGSRQHQLIPNANRFHAAKPLLSHIGYLRVQKRRMPAISANDVASLTIPLKDVVQELLARME